MAFLRVLCLSIKSSYLLCPTHWNGVNALGTKQAVLKTIFTAPGRSSFGIAKNVSIIFSPSLAIPSISSFVSVGNPVIKYNLTRFHPASNANLHPCKISSWVRFLLMTSLSLWVPASGANVKLLLRTPWTFVIKSTESSSILREGKDIFTFSVLHMSKRPFIKSGSWE